MSKFTTSIAINVSSDVAKTQKAMINSFNAIKKSSKSLQDSLIKNAESINRMGAAANKAKMALGAMAAIGVGSIIKFGSEYQTALGELSAITGISGDALDRFGAQALESSRRFGITGRAYLEAVKLIGSAKPELLAQPAMLKEVTDQSILLAKAQRMDLRSATMATTTALNQFGKSGEEASRVVNLLAAGSKFGSSEVSDISMAMINVGGTASALGLGLDETNAALQVMAKKGELGAIAGTRLKSALIKMTKTTDKFNPQVVGLSAALHNLKNAGLEGTQMLDVFGAEGINAGSALIELIDVYDDLLSKTNGTNVAQEQAAVNMATFTEATKRLASTIQSQLIPVFLKYEPVLSKSIEKFSIMIGDTEKMKKIAKVAGVVLIGLVSAITAITAAQIALNIAMIANPIGVIIMAVAAGVALLGAAIGAVVIYWDEIKAAVTSFGHLMKGVMMSVGKFIFDALLFPLRTVLKLISKIPKIGGFAKTALEGLESVETKMFGDIQSDNKSTLDVNMRIDQDGRAKVESATSSNNLNFGAQTALMIPSY